MDLAERLADYLAGELDPDETAALEADLARDPRLRARLEALQRADRALGTLSSPAPPPGFEDRLRARLAAELEDELGAAPAATVPVDELAERRVRRGRPRLLPALAGVAAAALLVVGVAVVTDLPGLRDDDEAGMAMDMAEEPTAEMDDAGAPEAMAAPELEGPVIVTSRRDLDAADADALLDADAVRGTAARGLDEVGGGELALAWAQSLRLGVADEPAADGDAPVEEEAEPPRTLAEEAPTPEEQADVARCLGELEAGGETAIPAYVELADFEGEPALVFGLVTLDPATGAYTRPEVWVLARADCQPLRFAQG